MSPDTKIPSLETSLEQSVFKQLRIMFGDQLADFTLTQLGLSEDEPCSVETTSDPNLLNTKMFDLSLQSAQQTVAFSFQRNPRVKGEAQTIWFLDMSFHSPERRNKIKLGWNNSFWQADAQTRITVPQFFFEFPARPGELVPWEGQLHPAKPSKRGQGDAWHYLNIAFPPNQNTPIVTRYHYYSYRKRVNAFYPPPNPDIEKYLAGFEIVHDPLKNTFWISAPESEIINLPFSLENIPALVQLRQ